jgi:cell division protein FtsZ
MFYMDESNGFSAKLIVVGVGGGGCNALNNMVESGVQGVSSSPSTPTSSR